jgi:hypothetical protein
MATRQDLNLFINTGPGDFGPVTTPQINTPSAFNSGNLFEQAQAFKDLALVGMIGIGAKTVFDSFTGNVGNFTGRTDLQRSINRAKKGFGIAAQIGVGLAFSPVAAGVAAGSAIIDFGIDRYELVRQRGLDNKEAEYRRELRGNRINESRSML